MTQSAGISKTFLKICFKFFYFTYSKVKIARVSFVYRLYRGLKSRAATIILGAIFVRYVPERSFILTHDVDWQCTEEVILQKLVL